MTQTPTSPAAASTSALRQYLAKVVAWNREQRTTREKAVSLLRNALRS